MGIALILARRTESPGDAAAITMLTPLRAADQKLNGSGGLTTWEGLSLRD